MNEYLSKKSLIAVTILSIVVLGATGESQAGLISFPDLSADPTLYGTNVFLDTRPASYGSLGLGHTPFVNDGLPLSQASNFSNGSTREAISLASPTSFSLGARAIDQVHDTFGPQAAAVAGTGFLVNGLAGGSIPGSITIHGDLSGVANVSETGLQFFLEDYRLIGGDPNGTYVELFIQNQSTLGGTRTPLSGDALSCFGPVPPHAVSNCFFDENIDIGYGAFAITIPFNIAAGPGNGIIAELYTEAFSFTGEQAGVDFLSTASVSFSPPPGVTLTLATGQTFTGGAGSTVPEPTTLWLLGVALAGLGFSRRRKLH